MIQLSEKNLVEIKDLLEDIKGLLILSNQEKLVDTKTKLLKSGSVEETIYKLCNGMTISDIAAKIKKTEPHVRAALSTLRQKGLIKTIESNGKTTYEQRF